jgi:hypothetical protein
MRCAWRTPGFRPRLWAGPGPLTLIQRRAREGALIADEEDLFAVPGGPLVLERTDRFAKHLRATLRPPGGPRVVVLDAAGRVYTNRFGRIGSRVARIPAGRARLLRIRARRAPLVLVVARVVDPDGHRRIAVIL